MRLIAGVALAVVVVGCGSADLREVHTNSGGILDCRSAIIEYTAFDSDISRPGARSPLEAAAALIGGEWLPSGVPQLESESGGQANVVVLDEDGNRIGRVGVVEHVRGWHVEWTESCG